MAQTWPSKEVIVVDDGSTDGTAELAGAFRSRALKLLSQEHRGASSARNKALASAQGDYIQWLDADDLLHPEKLRHQMKAAMASDDAVLLSSAFGSFYYRAQKAVFAPNSLWQDLGPVEWFIRKYDNGHFMFPGAWLVSRKLTARAGVWDERLTLDDDGEYFSRVVAACDAVKFVPEALSLYRQANPGSISKTINRKACQSLLLSYKLAIGTLLALEDSERTRSCAVRQLQANLIHFYPEQEDLLHEVYDLAKGLGGALSPPPFSNKYLLLNKMLGLAATKKVASKVRSCRHAVISKSDETMMLLELLPQKLAKRNVDISGRPKGDAMSIRALLSAGKTELHHVPRAIFSRYYCQKPRQVDIELSNRCNLHCRMCWFHGESGVGNRYPREEMSTREVFDLVDHLAADNPGLHIYLGGAEPCVREDFQAIVRHMKTLQLGVSFTTNGTLLDPEMLKELVAMGVDSINFSIDGNEELHDGQRGAGVFEKVTGNVRALSEYKLRAGCSTPVITVNITVSAALVGHLRETLQSIKSATHDGADYYRIHHQWYVSPGELSAHQSTIKEKLGCQAPGAAGHLIGTLPIPEPFSLVSEMDALLKDPKVRAFPDLSNADVINYYSDLPRLGKRCMAPLFGAIIKPNGDVTFCPDGWIDDYVVGNVRQQSFQEIWNNERARRFRSVVIKEKHFQGCTRCSWMYVY